MSVKETLRDCVGDHVTEAELREAHAQGVAWAAAQERAATNNRQPRGVSAAETTMHRPTTDRPHHTPPRSPARPCTPRRTRL